VSHLDFYVGTRHEAAFVRKTWQCPALLLVSQTTFQKTVMVIVTAREPQIFKLRSCPVTDTDISGDELSCFATEELIIFSEAVMSLNLPGGNEKNHENSQSR
jgi:hypothetical protein